MTGFPNSLKVEIEWVTGSNTWADVTPDVDMSAGIQIRYGRSTSLDQPAPATFTCQLSNQTGKYTPGTQLLADGVTANPNWPNVVPRRRIRFSWVFSSTQYFRYFGFIRGFPPNVENGVRSYVTIVAICRLQQLGQIPLRGWFREECELQTPNLIAYYPLSDPAPTTGLGSASFADATGQQPSIVQPYIGQTAYAALTAGAQNPMPQSEGQSGAAFSADSSGNTAGALQAFLPLLESGMAFGQWVTFPAYTPGVTASLSINLSTRNSTAHYIVVEMDQTSTGINVSAGEGTPGSISLTFLTSMTANQPHFVYVMLISAGGGNFTLGVSVDSGPMSTLTVTHSFTISQLEYDFFQSVSAGSIVLGPVAVWVDPAITVGVPVASDLYNAGNGWAGQLSGARIQKILTYGGLTSTDWAVDTGGVTLSGFQQILGSSILSACQQIAVTEGAGSAIYTQTDGKIRFTDRNSRTQNFLNTANMFLDAVKDLSGSAYAPAYDDQNLINSSTVSRAGGATQTYSAAASVTQYGLIGESVTSYAASDTDALALAQYRVAAQAPQFRVGQLPVNFITATGTDYGQLGHSLIGSQVEVDSLTAGLNAPTSKQQMFVEGWSETITITSQGQSGYLWQADTSPAPAYWANTFDNANSMWWPDDGTWTLTSAITASATSISLTTTAGHLTLSTTAGDFPLYIQIGTEVMQISSAPSGSTSPQTLTVVRGQQSTRAAAQAAGSAITFWPSAGWAL